MIKLATDCDKCIHKNICRNKDNAKSDMEKLKKMTYGKGPNDDYDWNVMMKHRNVIINFSCPDFLESKRVRDTQFKW